MSAESEYNSINASIADPGSRETAVLIASSALCISERISMAILAHQCPHPKCLTTNIGLQVVAATRIKNEYHGVVHLSCPKCHLPSAALVFKAKQQGSGIAHITGNSGDVTNMGFEVVSFWPDPPKPNVPELLPPDVARIYLQAERNFTIDGNEEASGTMYRKALDIGLKKIDGTLTGTLYARIKALAAAGKLTTDIAAWADIIRDDGNDAAHEEAPISRDDLAQLRNLSEMVLRYLFSLPNAVKKRRGEKLPWEEADTTSTTASA
ncbi:MAG: DUF4145 domain-containing protein [Xanthobacteraceae bacterium]|nr:DUF4145 domain-containing protein [Xanthobacteraceae bacterium]